MQISITWNGTTTTAQIWKDARAMETAAEAAAADKLEYADPAPLPPVDPPAPA